MAPRRAPAQARAASALREFLHNEAAAGLVLMAVAAVALVVANSPLGPRYFAVLESYVGGLSLLHWINDGLMAVFFLLVGLEVKRELIVGELSRPARRLLPGVAALGGMVVPALIYIVVNWQTPETLRGWAIPAATDIAFALGLLALLGRRVPPALKVFLTAVAIIDDLGAVAIIAFFYTAELSLAMLALSAAVLGVLAALNRYGVERLTLYLLLGALLWVFVLRSGVHATLAGVALALAIPLRPPPRPQGGRPAPLHRLEHAIHPWVAFLIVPLFGFANAGVSFAGAHPSILLEPVPLGIALGLFFGKQIGILGSVMALKRLGLAGLPGNATVLQIYGIALVAGIGFTMSLFIGLLAFPGAQEAQGAVKLGVFSGSLASGVAGYLVLRFAPPARGSAP